MLLLRIIVVTVVANYVIPSSLSIPAPATVPALVAPLKLYYLMMLITKVWVDALIPPFVETLELLSTPSTTVFLAYQSRTARADNILFELQLDDIFAPDPHVIRPVVNRPSMLQRLPESETFDRIKKTVVEKGQALSTMLAEQYDRAKARGQRFRGEVQQEVNSRYFDFSINSISH